MFDASATAVVAVDDSATIRYLNARAVEVFGFAAAELLGQKIELLVPGDRAAGHVAHRDEYLRAPTPRPLDARLDLKGRRKDGTEFAAEISLTPLDTTSGPWVAASVLDISARRDAEARVRDQSRSYLALARLNEAVAGAEDEQGLFHKVCNVAVVHGGYAGAWIVAEGPGSTMQIKASAGPLATRLAVASADSPDLDHYVTEQLQEVRRIGSGEPGALVALTTGEASFTDDLAAEGEALGELAASLGMRSAAALPMMSRGSPVACLCLYSERPGAFDASLRALLIGAADNISLALDRFRTRADLARALSQRTKLLRRLVDAQERERARIAADVHDDPVQSLAAVDLRLGLLERQLTDAAPQLVGDVVRIHETVNSVNEGLRDLLFELEPVAPSANLTHLLEEAAAHIFELTSVDWVVENEPDPRELELSVTTRTQAVRIAKEALSNVAKHAQATTATIRVLVDDHGVTVEVADNGIGLPPGMRSSPPGHRGISGMLDRAEVSGGSLSVDTEAGGTTISVWLPSD